MRRAQAAEQAETDPEAAAWQLRTRVRHNEDGSFSLTVSGPAEFLPVLQAGIEAKKAELQRQRDAETAATTVAQDVPAETPEPEPEDVPAETPEPTAGHDEQLPGWPEGTTGADARKATVLVHEPVPLAGARPGAGHVGLSRSAGRATGR